MNVRVAAGIVLIVLGAALLLPGANYVYMITRYYVIGTSPLFFGQLAAWTFIGVALIAIGIWLLRRGRRLKNSN
jgi:hypothetical protein